MSRDTLFIAADGRLRPSWRFGASFLVVVVAMGVASSTAAILAGRHPLAFPVLFLTLLMALLLGGFSALLYALDGVRSPLLAAMGLAWRRPGLGDSVAGLGLGAGMVALAVAAIAIFGDLSFTVHAGLPHALRALVVELWLLATAAMVEELTFRGYPFQRVLEAMGAPMAVAALSGLFAVVHAGNPESSLAAMLNTVLMGVLLSVAYLRTRALWLPWGIHLGWNATLGVGFGLPVSGYRDFAVVVRGAARGPLWLTGGAYGIEASAVGTTVIILGTLALLALFRARPAPEIVLSGRGGSRPLSLLEKREQDPVPRIRQERQLGASQAAALPSVTTTWG